MFFSEPYTVCSPIYFHSLQDLMSFLAKCLDVDPNHISCDQVDRILVGERGNKPIIRDRILIGETGNRLIIRYRVVHSCLRIEKITWRCWANNTDFVAHFAIFRPGYRYKRDLYKALRAWYTEIQFKRLEHVFS